MDERKPFNDANEHLTKHVGIPQKVEINKLPKPLRFFGYFVITFVSLSTILIIIGLIITYMK